jgi:tRNA (mo5U34)-methyltransferase
MNLNEIRKERQKWFNWKNIKPIYDALEKLKATNPKVTNYKLNDTIEIELDKSYESEYADLIEDSAKLMLPWRKGPFKIGSLFIDTEWQSFIKYNLLEPHFNLKDKIVADVGCNNGYYMFRMLSQKPKKLVGFDPSALFYMQFSFINSFINSDIKYELLGIEHIEHYEHKFDTIFCLGVLYHRSDPIGSLKSLYKSLNKDGKLILDTFMIDGNEDICLTPKERYSKIPNIYFIPTINALKNWCFRAGFKEVEILTVKKTELNEQRKTDWINSQSLNDFLDPKNPDLTIEGYPAPKRVYIKAIKN